MPFLWLLGFLSEIALAVGVAFLLYLVRDPLVRQQVWAWLVQHVRTAGSWKPRMVLIGGPVLIGGLSASFACARSTSQHLDPVIFCALQLLPLAPFACWVLRHTHRTRTEPACSAALRAGVCGGCLLAGGMLCGALSLRALGIVPTAMLTALDGVLASLLAWGWTRTRPSSYGLLAVLCALAGSGLLWWIAPGHWQQDLVAIGCGGCFLGYGLPVERRASAPGSLSTTTPFFGSLFATMGLATLLLALCLGDWTSLQTLTGMDLVILGWCGLGTVAVPVILLTLLLHRLSAVTLAFLALIEPLTSLLWATALGSLSLPPGGWIGVGCLVVSLLIHTRAVASPSKPSQDEHTPARGEGETAMQAHAEPGQEAV